MKYSTIKEIYNTELNELQVSGITEVKVAAFIQKYEEMLKLYRKIHPFRSILIRLFPYFGNKW